MLLYLVVNDLLVEAREALSKVVEVVDEQTHSNSSSDSRSNIARSVVYSDLKQDEESKEIVNVESSASVKTISASWYAQKIILCLKITRTE